MLYYQAGLDESGLKMYKRVLLAYDGSLEGRTALREGALLARPRPAHQRVAGVWYRRRQIGGKGYSRNPPFEGWLFLPCGPLCIAI